MKLYRADTSKDPEIYTNLCFTTDPEDAEAYTHEMQSHEGEEVYEYDIPIEFEEVAYIDDDWFKEFLIEVLDLKTRNIYTGELEEMYPSEVIPEIEESTGSRWPYAAVEEFPEVMEALRDEGFLWVTYEDDFPSQAQTYQYIGEKTLHLKQ